MKEVKGLHKLKKLLETLDQMKKQKEITTSSTKKIAPRDIFVKNAKGTSNQEPPDPHNSWID